MTKFKASEKQLCRQLEKQSIEQSELNPTKSDENKYRKYDKIEVDLRKLIFNEKALQSLLFSRKQFLKTGITFEANLFTDEHLAGLLKAELKGSQLEALQKSIEFVTGQKLTSNLRANTKAARQLGLSDAGVAGEIHSGEEETAKFWYYTHIKELCELMIRSRVPEVSQL